VGTCSQAERLMSAKTWLLQMLEAVIQEQYAFLAACTKADLAEIGTLHDWSRTSPKAIVSHNTMWNKKLLGNCRAALQGLKPAPFSDGTRLNDQNFLEQVGQSLEHVLKDSIQTIDSFVQLIQTTSEVQFTTTELFGGQTRPLWRMLPGTILVHPILHFVIFEASKGHFECASVTSQRLFDLTKNMGGEDTRGVAHYNLACCHAKIGWVDKAIQHLSQAIGMLPPLLESAKQDPHLSSLHGSPQFAALCGLPS
jgi:hypothetical protein